MKAELAIRVDMMRDTLQNKAYKYHLIFYKKLGSYEEYEYKRKAIYHKHCNYATRKIKKNYPDQ